MMRPELLCLALAAVLGACGADREPGGSLTGSDAAGPTSDGGNDPSPSDAAKGATDAPGDQRSPDASRPLDGSPADGSLDVEAGVGVGDAGCSAPATYDETVLCDHPVAFWAMNQPSVEPDLTGNGHAGTYKGGAPALAPMPNGDQAADFDGASEYLTIPSDPSFSIPTTGELSWEGWIRPDTLQFPHDDGTDGYVDWMGKCADYSPTCEWEARMYDTNTTEVPNRCNRLSGYVFNPGAGLGSAADWQPTCGLIRAGTWYHVVAEYTTKSQPADCPSAPGYPGSIDIWVNGVEWNQADHNTTGCMSQYNVAPVANDSPLNIGTMALDSWFQGAIGKVAIYGHLLSAAQVAAHYAAMTAKTPAGSCADTCTL